MSEFSTALRGRVDDAVAEMATARQVGQDYETVLHAGRIHDLLDLAARHGISTLDWVDLTTLPAESAD